MQAQKATDIVQNKQKQQNLPNKREPIQDDDEIEEGEEKDEIEGRASVAKYTDTKQKGVKPADKNEEPEERNSLEESVSSKVKSKAQETSSAGKKAAKDAYYYDLQEFVDNTLKSIASKIAEKKTVELETTSLKIELNKLKEDTKKEVQMQKVIQKNLEQEIEVCKKREKENQDLEELLRVIQEKTEERKNEINIKLEEAEAISNKAKEAVASEQSKFLSIKQQLDEDKAATRAEVKNLEIELATAANEIEQLKKKISHAGAVENERVKMLRQKSKILAALIGQETTTGKSSIQKDLSKILKSPHKQSSIMQSASRSYSKV